MAQDGGDNAATKRKCPMCGKPVEHRYRPFCSRRCADIDLGRWFTGAYSTPSVEDPDGFEEAFSLQNDPDNDPDNDPGKPH